MLKVKKYRDWSGNFHQAHYSSPLAIQIELTYQCPLHCLHCYCDCYNRAEFIKNQLPTEEVKLIIDKLHKEGSLWLCFTGGDPMIREDFLELYSYAKDKGFISTIFTSLIALSSKTLEEFIKKPPFSIETTLNAATKETFEKISQVKGSFKKVISNLKKISEAGLPLKIKTLLSKNNFQEKDKLRSLVESFGCEFRPSYGIYARLNGDTLPLRYRLKPEDIAGISEQELEKCCNRNRIQIQSKTNKPNPYFRCGVGNWQWFIDPLGRLNICNFLRTPSYDLLRGSLSEGKEVLSGFVNNQRFRAISKCKNCQLWLFCQSCPAKARIEAGNKEAPIPYYCQLAKFSKMVASQ